MSIEVVVADYANARHGRDITELLDSYASDPMGGGEPLPAYVREHLVSELSKLPNAFSLICYVDGSPAGLANCFEGFSTFRCKPLINIHDVVVKTAFRGRGISQHLLAEVERLARQKGCCKITLEVLEGNVTAQQAYKKYGFEAYQLDAAMGQALFWQKSLDDRQI